MREILSNFYWKEENLICHAVERGHPEVALGLQGVLTASEFSDSQFMYLPVCNFLGCLYQSQVRIFKDLKCQCYFFMYVRAC